jgi:hypothetical protein
MTTNDYSPTDARAGGLELLAVGLLLLLLIAGLIR